MQVSLVVFQPSGVRYDDLVRCLEAERPDDWRITSNSRRSLLRTGLGSEGDGRGCWKWGNSQGSEGRSHVVT